MNIDQALKLSRLPYLALVPQCSATHLDEEGNELPVRATHLAPQSPDVGRTVTWAPICADEIPTWWDGSDWWGPIFEIGS